MYLTLLCDFHHSGVTAPTQSVLQHRHLRLGRAEARGEAGIDGGAAVQDLAVEGGAALLADDLRPAVLARDDAGLALAVGDGMAHPVDMGEGLRRGLVERVVGPGAELLEPHRDSAIGGDVAGAAGPVDGHPSGLGAALAADQHLIEVPVVVLVDGADDGLDRDEGAVIADLILEAAQLVEAAAAGVVAGRDAEPNVLRDARASVARGGVAAHLGRALGEDLEHGVGCGLHLLEDAVEEIHGDLGVKQIGHRVDEDHARARALGASDGAEAPGLGQAIGVQAEVEAAHQADGDELGVAVVALGPDLVAAHGGVPR